MSKGRWLRKSPARAGTRPGPPSEPVLSHKPADRFAPKGGVSQSFLRPDYLRKLQRIWTTAPFPDSVLMPFQEKADSNPKIEVEMAEGMADELSGSRQEAVCNSPPTRPRADCWTR